MDPSSGRDRNSNSSPSEPENPFIRFKNFADSQISSLLQGIIGLPSAISRRSSEQNRWADVDEDLRRRDELQERQRALVSQWRETAEKADNTIPEEIPVKKSPHYQASKISESDSHWQKLVNGKESLTGDDSNANQDLPLYSPVRKELFEKFRTEDSPSNALFSSFLGFPKHDFKLSLPIFDPNIMIKDLSHTYLEMTTDLHSEYSLLPYILFSPYSPIKLELDARMSVNSKINNMQYCAAFEDLIRTTQGRTPSIQSYCEAEKVLKTTLFDVPGVVPGSKQWLWTLFLARDGILHQKRQDSDPIPDLKAWRAGRGSPLGSDLDMFEHIQRKFSEPADANPPASLGGLLPRKDQHNDSEMRALREFAERGLQSLERSKPITKEDDERTGAAVSSRNVKNGLATDKVVLTQTSTTRTAQEDGAVETRLTVWKLFEDGRQSTTTTIHVEEPSWSDGESSWDDERASKQDEKEAGKDEKKEKKGWFWN